ncbi:MAG TPA: dipeptide ABC transporter ATP-binding protein [Candidatus Limnocylindrales bacterium]
MTMSPMPDGSTRGSPAVPPGGGVPAAGAVATSGGRDTTGAADAAGAPLLSVEDLKIWFPITEGIVIERHVGDVRAVDGIDLSIRRGETLGLVGESGCGKSTTGRGIIRLYKPTAGRIVFDGVDLASLEGRALRRMRRRMQMIFQDPYASLNPRMNVAAIVGEPLDVHGIGRPAERRGRVRELLATVGMNPDFADRYPHEFSGGQRQRIGVARALSLNPDLIVADEPISALDVSIQAQIINLLERLQGQFGLTYLFIAHDLSVVRHISDRIAVMYLGKIMEMGDRDQIYLTPHHPYTQALLSAAPDVRQAAIGGRRERIRLEGDVPSPINPPSGCRFRTRCWKAQEICANEEPPLLQVGGRQVACHFAEPLQVIALDETAPATNGTSTTTSSSTAELGHGSTAV